MSTSSFHSRFLRLPLWLALLFSMPLCTAAQPAPGAELEALSRASGIPAERLQILYEQESALPVLGTRFTAYKVLDTRTQQTLKVALDPALAAIDHDQLLARERAAHWDRYGNLHPGVLRSLEAGKPSPLPVLLKLAIPEPRRIDRRKIHSQSELDAVMGLARELEAEVEAGADSLFRLLLREQGLPGTTPFSLSGPFVSAELPPAALRALAHDRRIAFIGPDQEPLVLAAPTIPQSLVTTQTNIPQQGGITGTDVRVAVLEPGSLTRPTACFNIQGTQSVVAAANDHFTASVGMIGNRYNAGACNGTWQGYGYGAKILLANYGNGNVATFDWKKAYDWARLKAARVVSMSWTLASEGTDGSALSSREVYFDYWADQPPYPTVVIAAGNLSTDFAAGKGYNMISVGNVINDGNNIRCDNLIHATSAWKDPVTAHKDREVPTIATPGSDHSLLGLTYGGTSAAAPATSGIVALLLQKNPALLDWPEAVRAILLATADYQKADGKYWAATVEGKDGVGMTNAALAVATAGATTGHAHGFMASTDFTGQSFDQSWTFIVSANGPKPRIRAALTWTSETVASNGVPVSSDLDGDLDLVILGPDNAVVAYSETYDSNHELVDFIAPVAGTYTIKINASGLPADFTSSFGLAWTQKASTATACK
jgi:hypothetical protein